MDKYLYLRVDTGLEGFLRIAGMLRRKRFNVHSVKMEKEEGSKYSTIIIGMHEEKEFTRAMNFLKKLFDVSEIREQGE